MTKQSQYNVDSNGGQHEVHGDTQRDSGSDKSTAPASSRGGTNDMDLTVFLDRDTLCGFLCLKPACLQPLRNMILFTFLYGLSILLTMALLMYFVTQITTLEKQLGLSSAESGVLLSANDVGFLVTVLFWSHFARKGHKPVILGVAAMIFGLAAIMCALPHFMLEGSPAAGGMGGVGLLCASEIMSIAINTTNENETTLPNSILESGTELESGSSAGVYRSAYIIFAVGMALQGIVKAPRRPVGMTYMDDNIPKSKLGTYFGFWMSMIIFGPVIGSVLGAVFSQMHVTLEETSMTLADPRWIGAWWLGFMVIGAVSVVAAIPLILFPKRMPNTEKITDLETKQKEETAKSLVSDFPKSAFRLMKNPLYVLLIISEGIAMFAASGATSFFPKYVEQHFLVPTWQAGIMMGACIAVAGVVASVLSGIMTSCLKLTLVGCLVVMCVTDALVVVCLFSGLAAICPQPIFHGLSSPSPVISHLAAEFTNMTCAGGCTPGCSESLFLPTCGADGLTYFSPCHAGCTGMLPNMTFTGCSCISDANVDTAMSGYCEGQCDSLPGFLALVFIFVFIGILSSVPQTVTRLRCVKERDRSLALGFNGFISSLIGYLLGPIAFGTAIDSTCLLWQGIPDTSNAGYCTLYDTAEFRTTLLTMVGGVRVGVLGFSLCSLVVVIVMPRYQKIVQEQREQYDVGAEEIRQKKAAKDGQVKESK